MKLTLIKNAMLLLALITGFSLKAQQGMGLKAPMVETLTELGNYQMTGNPDLDFASIMLIHHRGSLDILDEAKADSSGAELTTLVNTLEQGINEEIKELEKFSNEEKGQSPNGEFVIEMKTLLGKSEEEIKRHSYLSGQLSHDFASIMTVNFKQESDMLNLELKYGKNAELKKLAQKLLEENQKELAEVQKLAGDNGMGTKQSTDSTHSSSK